MPTRQPAASVKPSARAVYQLKIALKGSKPPIWRRVETLGKVTLAELHDIIQIAMGWDDDHLHEFEAGRTRYGVPDDESEFSFGFDLGLKDESRARLYKVAPAEGSRLQYVYDFGDSWEHSVIVEKILPQEPGITYPRCLKGVRACPPEDCGGVWGYEQLLEAREHPDDPNNAELLDWMEGDFDPEAFSVEDVNKEFSEMATRPRGGQDIDGLLIGDSGLLDLLGVFGAAAPATSRERAPASAISLDALEYQFTTPPLLIGGKAMERYGLRATNKTVSFVVARADYDALAALHPAHLKDLQGDLCVVHGMFEVWASVARFDYTALAVDAVDEGAYRVISAEKLLLLVCLNLDSDPQNLLNILLLVQYIRKRQYGMV